VSDPFVHLHTHCEYSLLDGLGRVGDLVSAAAALHMPALALTDHGTMFGAIEFYEKAKDKGVKPIIGCEVYLADRPIGDRPGPDAKNYHLVLLAENEVGYRNLIHLATEAQLRGFYRKPRIDHHMLAAHSEGLVCLSGCASSELASIILSGDLAAAEEKADWYRQVFGDRYYLELQYHDLDFQVQINQGVVHVSQKLGLPLVATNDVHYVEARHASAHEILLCVQTQTTLADPKRMRLGSHEFYLKSPDEMARLFGSYPGALRNTLEIAERCNLQLTFGRPQLPTVEVPEGLSSEGFLRRLCEEGLARRYRAVTPAIRERLEYELSIIEKTGFLDYFLLVYDVMRFARESGIPVGPGRGSSAGSLVAYVLFVTNVDPIEHELSFERFLNPERVTMPDMDLDFADDRRDELIRYVTEKYGRDRVAQIITFGTIGARAGVRDVGRVLGLSYGDVDRVAKLIPAMNASIESAKNDVPELQELYDSDPAMRRLLDTVQDLEGVARHASTHAAGVVIARDPLSQHVPLYKVPKNDQVVTQYAMSSIEKIGLLKMDFLGLRTLTVLQRACNFIKSGTGTALTPDEIPLDDPSIFRLLSSGDTFGVFQVDGDGMRRLLMELQPDDFGHIVAVVALYRPGPMKQIPDFVKRRHGRETVEYVHPALEEVLAPTFGILVYQEQVMRLFNLVAGYSMGEADLVRRAMAKKKPEELAKHHSSFLDRAEDRGTSRAIAQQLWDIVEPFCGYAFPKPHAAAYAVLTCQTAYLKANYPREYLAGIMSAERGNADRISDALSECRRLRIPVFGADVNRSDVDFTLEDSGIRLGLGAIKHVGDAVAESIVNTRNEGGPFVSIEDFCRRVDWKVVNKRCLEPLIKCGALDSLGVERGKLLHNIEALAGFGAHLQRAALAGPSLFGEVEEPEVVLPLELAAAASLEDKLAWEQDLLGVFVSPHPLADSEDSLAEIGVLKVRDLTDDRDGTRVRVAGMIQKASSFSTRNGSMMGSFQLTGTQGSIKVTVFSRSFEKLQPEMVEGRICVVEGRVDASDGKLQLVADRVLELEQAAREPMPSNGKRNGSGSGNGHGAPSGASNAPMPAAALASPPRRRIRIDVQRSADRQADLERLQMIYGVILDSPGPDEVEIMVHGQGKPRSVPLPHRYVGHSERLENRLREIAGEGSVAIIELRSQVETPPS
jgi:DNA polymerase-3 subunit alpha